jgi:CHAT domain-containing protein/Flp pilus assembly protein TadD
VRILSLSAVLSLLILCKGAKPSEGSQQAHPPAAVKKTPSPPRQPLRHEFLHLQGRRRALTLAMGEVHAYLFDLEPDDFVDIKVEQDGLDITAKIASPGKLPPIDVDRMNGGSGLEAIPLLAAVSGRYRVELTGNGIGTYEIMVAAKRRATQADRQNAAGASAFFHGMELRATHPKEAEKAFRNALTFWKACGFRAGEADAAWRLGGVLFDREAGRGALPIFEKSLIRYRELKNHRQEMVVLDMLGLAHKDLGQNDQALASFDRALVLAHELSEHNCEADILTGRGALYSELGELGKALPDLEAALALHRSLRDSVPLANTLNVLGRAYYIQNDLDKALSSHQEALALLKDHPDTCVMSQTLTHLADINRKKGDFKEAASLYLRALSLMQGAGRRRLEASALNNLALTYLEVGRFHEALGAFQHCRRVFSELGDTEAVARAWTNLGWVLVSMRRFNEARAAYGRALAMSEGKKGSFLEVASNYGLARCERLRGNLITAQLFLEKSLSSVELIRSRVDRENLRTLFLAGKQDVYELLVEILMDRHRLEPTKGYDIQAFLASERARSRTLLDQLSGQPVLPSLSVQDIQRQVLGSGDVVLLEYFLGDKRSYLWVVTSSSFTSVELPVSRDKLAKLARDVNALLAESNKLETRSIAIRKSVELSRLLLGQVATRLDGKKLLIVAPPQLQYVSFGALPEDMRESALRNIRWPRPWALDHEITVELSANVPAALRRSNENEGLQSDLIAILADPVYSSDDKRFGGEPEKAQTAKQPRLPRLRFSRSEAEAIAAAVVNAGLGKAKQLRALDFDASRQRVLDGILKGFRYLHFSAHGDPDARSADRSAVVLSLVDRQGKPIDGFLRAGEIANLELSADLVVLSACKTGLGREIPGEGLVGLTQAFFTAGASRVMVSLWDVDDQATALLMGRFYQSLLQNHLSPGAALQEAETWMWRQPRWSAPSYWGGFVLQGEWK